MISAGMLTVTLVAVLKLCVTTGAGRVVVAAVVKVAKLPSVKFRFERPLPNGLTATLNVEFGARPVMVVRVGVPRML